MNLASTERADFAGRLRRAKAGFTLVEIMIASMLMVISVSMAIGGLVYVLRSTHQNQIQQELDIGVQNSMERLKLDLRLSALDQMYFNPSGSGVAHTNGVSFPIAIDDNNDGAVELYASTGKVIWDKTVVYHVWNSAPNELRCTTFYSVNSNLYRDPKSNTYLQAQLDSVVATGNGESWCATYGGTSSWHTLFENMMSWGITERGGRFDGYSASTSKSSAALGSVILSNGSHTLRFTTVGRNTNSSGFNIGVDTITMSPCRAPREAETQLVSAAVGAATSNENMQIYGIFGGEYHLFFPATATNQSFTLTMADDAWEETNFENPKPEDQDNNTVRYLSTDVTPYDYVVKLDGPGTWAVSNQTSDTVGGNSAVDELKDVACRVLIRGQNMPDGSWITADGGQCRLNFKACSPTGALWIEDAFISRSLYSTNPSMDAASNGLRVTFATGQQANIGGGSNAWSDWLNFSIKKTNSYVVSFLVKNNTQGNAWYWSETNYPSVPGCYIIPSSVNPDEDDTRAAEWSLRGDVITTNKLFALAAMELRYPTNGYYISAILDTTMAAPAYTELAATVRKPLGTESVKFKIGTSDDADMSSSDWSATWEDAPIVSFPSDKRYIQWIAMLKPDAACTSSPELKDVKVTWPGPDEQSVDIAAAFTQGPDYGIIELTVDGQQLRRGLGVDLSIYKKATIFRGTNTMTSALSTEIEPRNTGK